MFQVIRWKLDLTSARLIEFEKSCVTFDICSPKVRVVIQ